ncbi:MAG TPA: hypothetical protein VD997_11910 [Phycisphaerales bacterium]|nr:hypothetical protein [Phycisphaerales bacterium]
MNMPTKNNSELRSWARVHAPIWVQEQATIGLSPQAAQGFQQSVDELEAAAAKVNQLRQAAIDATLEYNNALAQVKRLGGANVNTIKAYAQASGDRSVFARASIEPNAGPGTLPPPVPPSSIAAQVLPGGALELRWKAKQPRGLENVQYQVRRSLNNEREWTLIGTAGSVKRYVDNTLPLGVTTARYLLTPWRGDHRGESSDVFTFQVGRAPSEVEAARRAA